MTGIYFGRIVVCLDKGYGWIVDETPGSSRKGGTVFYHPKNINGGKHLVKGARVTFDVADDPQHPGKTHAVNIDAAAVSR